MCLGFPVLSGSLLPESFLVLPSQTSSWRHPPWHPASWLPEPAASPASPPPASCELHSLVLLPWRDPRRGGLRLSQAGKGGAGTEHGEWVATLWRGTSRYKQWKEGPGPHPAHQFPVKRLWPASVDPPLGHRNWKRPSEPRVSPLIICYQPDSSRSISSTYLVRTNEPDKHWEEHRRGCGLGTLAKIAHNCIVGLLGEGQRKGHPSG